MLDPHLSALLWMGVFATLIIVIIMPQPLGVRALVIITILRLIFSVGLEPTLFLLGAFNVSCTVAAGSVVDLTVLSRQRAQYFFLRVHCPLKAVRLFIFENTF